MPIAGAVLCLSVSAGGTVEVFGACGRRSTLLKPLDFVSRYDLAPYAVIRVVGSRRTLGLVAALGGVRAKVFLAPSGFAGTADEELASLWQPAIYSRFGPSRLLTPEISIGYSLAWLRQMKRPYAGFDTGHPAWPAVSFGRDHPLAVQFLTEVVDPGWYTHLERPGRPTRLYAAMGISPRNAKSMLDGSGRGDSRFLRFVCCALLAGKALGPPTEGTDPLLRQVRRFVGAVLHYWRSEVSTSHPELRTFDAVRAFGCPQIASAFASHLAKLRPSAA